MKKILLSLMAVVTVVAIGAGATYAYFSARGSVDNNTVTTGTLKLAVNEGAGKPITISGVLPGYADSNWRWFDAYNNGSLPAEYFLRFKKTDGSNKLFNSLWIELRDGGYMGNCDGPEIYAGLLKDFENDSKISNFNVHAYRSDSSVDNVKDDIHPGWTMRVCQKLSLPETGTDQNDIQGASVTFDEIVNSRQDHNPDWLPVVPALTGEPD